MKKINIKLILLSLVSSSLLTLVLFKYERESWNIEIALFIVVLVYISLHLMWFAIVVMFAEFADVGKSPKGLLKIYNPDPVIILFYLTMAVVFGSGLHRFFNSEYYFKEIRGVVTEKYRERGGKIKYEVDDGMIYENSRFEYGERQWKRISVGDSILKNSEEEYPRFKKNNHK